ncbi:ribonuclease G [Catalinimonas alkaloidigena]|uniref:Ribonuclease G n=1 Tax=Catalinimonas alkaloidigena TaxID=1075417 RepID=A0A1G9ESZ7_9BACT|nr:Rne/Rng family ribonuclease [Catalinimonas alkaloidigena]SDK79260.1 ribonuclease G [Catalinimonas alkaloidigena]
MNNELAISSTPKGDRIALVQDKRLVEFHFDQHDEKFTVGDIYLGTVRKVSQGLNAAFVDVGYEKDAFLHYHDLGPQVRSLLKYVKTTQSQKGNAPRVEQMSLESDIDKLGKITQVLNRNQQILVQVIKEPISTKGPRLSCEISLAGRYLVLVPFSNTISVSKKVTSKEERQRLQRLISSIKPANFGVIIRTVAEGKEVAELDRDLRNLLKKWEDGFQKLQKAKPRDKVIGEMGRASSLLRDLLNESFDNITVDSREIYEEVKEYIRTIAPDKEKIVRLHNSSRNKLFEVNGIEKQIRTLFGKTVSLPSGGYLVIEHTEALHVIDVNSGNSGNRPHSEDQESTALRVNSEAVKEVARQLRLRDIGGIIVIDFIDQKKTENRRKIYDEMRQEMKEDRSRHTVLPLSKFGIMQITRQRVRPEMNVVTRETCPTCGGSGTISASIAVADQIENNLDFILNKQNEKKVTISVHPFLHSYFTKGFISKRLHWMFHYGTWINVQPDSSLGITDYKFFNRNGEAIEAN